MTQIFIPTENVTKIKAYISPDVISGRKRYWAIIQDAETGAILWHGGWPSYQKKHAKQLIDYAITLRPWEVQS
jgi:hypothetical protein